MQQFWDLLRDGRCSVSSIPPDRWSLERLLHPRLAERGKSYTWAAGVLDDIWSFDPGAFAISPREAEQMDPQQRLLLELAWEAFEDAGICLSKLAGSATGVFIGASAVDHSTLRMQDLCSADAYMMTGNTLSVISNRLSYAFDLHGPSFTIDTACSSSLVAVNEAVNNLRNGRIETAIVGGVSILAAPHAFIGFSQAAMLSRRGLCQAFSAHADGYVRAEGGVALVLKTRAAAERDQDHIYGFIVDCQVNSDGRTNGISLPSKRFQAGLLEELYVKRGIDLSSLAFIEAHGTGTPVGDPIEAAAIGETLGRSRKAPLLIGSVKTNIGHMEAASGLGGLLKALLALEHRQLPASLHSEELNPHIDFDALNLEVARELTPLDAPTAEQWLAGVNSFGFGGTNAHVILAAASTPPAAAVATPPSYLVLSAQSRSALNELAANYAERFEAIDDDNATIMMSATAHRRDRLNHRIVIPVDSRVEIVKTLDRLRDEEQDMAGVARGTAVARTAPVAFVFSGNGSQFVGMGLAAYERNAVFKAHIDVLSKMFAELAGWSIVEMLHSDELASKIEETRVSQPLLFAVQSAACHALKHAGLEPSFVLGHSVGEVAAAEAAGILSSKNALKTIYLRSLHQELTRGRGSMAVVIGPLNATQEMLSALPGCEIAAYNSPRAFTISGKTAEIEQLSEMARDHKARVRKLDLRYPFHSVLMGPVEGPLVDSLADVSHDVSDLTFISTVTGAPMRGDDLDARYWWRNVREPVRFSDAIAAAADKGACIFVEIGPNATLLSHINDTIGERAARIATLAAMDKRDKGVDPLSMAVALAIARGAEVDETKAFGTPPTSGARVELPHYPWQRKVYRLPETPEAPVLSVSLSWHPLIGSRPYPDHLEWRTSLDTAVHPWLADHCVEGRAILPGAAFAEMALAVARDWLGTDQAIVSDIEITSPMQLTADHSREVCCRLSPVANHLEVVSRPRLSTSPWQTHVTAKIVRDSRVNVPPDVGDHPHATTSHSVTGAEIYAMADRAGLQYGPAFQKLKKATAVRPDRIVLELTKEDAEPAFGLDPARLDSCFHALVLVFSSLRDAARGTAYVPVRFGEIILRSPGTTFTKACIDIVRRDERIIIADFRLTDDAGNLVACIHEARFQAIRASRTSDSEQQVILQTSVLAGEPVAARSERALALTDLRNGITRATAKAMSDDYVLLEGWATSLALQTACVLATANFIDVDALISTGRLPTKVRRWFENVLLALERSGLCHRDRLGRHIDPDIELPAPDQILHTIAHEHQALAPELLLASSASVAVDSLLTDDTTDCRQPLPSKVIDAFEMGSSYARSSARYLNDRLRQTIATWPRDRAIRILQIGHGPLTSLTLSLAEEAQATLTLFDLDKRRLERARMTFADRGDIDFIDKTESLPVGGFDLVLSAHTLHRYDRKRGTLAAIRRAMASGALFFAVEPTPSFFRDLVLGLHASLSEEGADLDGLSVGEADWLETMQGAGLQDPQVVPVTVENGTALALTAQLDAERFHWRGEGSAFIVADPDTCQAEVVSALATLLASSGLHVSIIRDDELDEERFAGTPSFVVLLPQGRDEKVPAAKRLRDQCFQLKCLADRLSRQKTRIWLVTRHAGTRESEEETDIATGIQAFSKTLANEVPSLDIRRIAVARGMPSELLSTRIRDLVLCGTDETDIILDEGTTHVTRLKLDAMQGDDSNNRAEAASLRRGESSGIDRIHWSAIQRHAPGAGEIEIAVDAVGLNFRDVMFGLGLLPEDILEHGFAGPTLGLECAGRVERVGAGVKAFARGDRVMAFAKSAFSSHVTTPATVAAPLPPDLSFEAAATIPVAFLTAYYALIICARLKADEWVLIHGGAGGVGLAALQIARWRKANVIATAGSPGKRSLLRSLGASLVFDSRSGAFVDQVRQVIGEGVAIVLNSLSGEAMERSISVLKPFGRFVELGKRDYVANTHIGLRPFRRNLSYFGVDLDQLLIDEPATSRLLFRSVMRLFDRGELTPLPYRSFDAADTIEAFRLMQQSGHIGKLVLRPPDLAAIKVKHRRTWQASAEKIHLITGGLGGFGLETATWLAAKGARNLLLVGRHAPSDQAKRKIESLMSQGVRVRIETLDVADKAAMQGLFARFGRDLPMLAGVVHAAMVLDDSLVTNLTADKFERVLRPKVTGASHLDQLTRDISLDYFILFSSATTLLGNPGQAAYVAANGYLEGLARKRRSLGLPALAVAWGAIEDVGVLARSEATREMLTKRAGVRTMMAQEALRLLGEILAAPSRAPEHAVVNVASINWAAARKHLAILDAPAYRWLSSHDEAVATDKEKIEIAALVKAHAPEEARNLIASLIVDEIATVLRLPREDIPRTTPLSEIGLDSLMAVELALGLEDRFTLNAPLSTVASSFTVNELAEHVVGLASGSSSEDDALAQSIGRHLGPNAEDAAHALGDVTILKAKSQSVTSLLN